MRRHPGSSIFATLATLTISAGMAAQPPASPPAPANDAPGVHMVAPLPGAEWHLPNGDLANTRYSTLDQLNATNVSELSLVSVMHTGIPNGHEGAPLVVGDTLYVVTPYPNILIAIDLTQPKGPVKWSFNPHPDPRAVGIACCDVVNRGAVFADGKIIYNTLDANTVAVDAKTGKLVWKTRVGDTNLGETVTSAPLVVKDRVIIGNSGGELGVRGWVKALAVSDGHVLWTAYNTGPDAEVKIGPDFKAFYAKDQGKDLGVSSWPPDQWKLGGSTVWGWISYDPELNLVYYGTGNPGVWNTDLRPGANKWSCSIIARNPDDGSARWAYQIVAHDAWDYDEIMENVLVDMNFKGQPRKLLLHPGRSGFMYVLDRATGELLSAEKFQQSTNWANGFDLATGKPRENADKRTKFGVVTKDICPSSTGAKEFVPSAFSPRTGLLYIPAHNTCMNYEGTEANYIAGTPYLGASVKMFPGPGGYQGELVAWDPAAGHEVWGIKDEKWPVYSGVLATAGDLVFFGTMDGTFKAANARDGKELWSFKTGSGIVGNPMTFTGPDGRQYVAVYSGIGGWMGAVAFPAVSEDDPYAALGVVGAMNGIKKYSSPGGALYVFGRK